MEIDLMNFHKNWNLLSANLLLENKKDKQEFYNQLNSNKYDENNQSADQSNDNQPNKIKSDVNQSDENRSNRNQANGRECNENLSNRNKSDRHITRTYDQSHSICDIVESHINQTKTGRIVQVYFKHFNSLSIEKQSGNTGI